MSMSILYDASRLVLNFLSLSTGVTSNRSEREVRGAGLVLQTVWGYKELRRTLEKDGWKKTDFMVNLNPPSNTTRTNGGYEDSTLPLIDKGQEVKVETHACKMFYSAGPHILSLISESKSSVCLLFHLSSTELCFKFYRLKCGSVSKNLHSLQYVSVHCS